MVKKLEEYIRNKSAYDNQIPQNLYQIVNENLSDKFLLYLQNLLDNNKLNYLYSPKPIFEGRARLLYRFQLDNSDKLFSKSLILRVYQEYIDDELIQFENLIQNLLNDQDFPTPRVLHYTNDKNILGGAFLIMEELPGQNMANIIQSHPLSVFHYTKILANTQIQLHSINPDSIINTLEQNGINLFDRSIQGRINYLSSFIESHSIDNLHEALIWILKNKPSDTSEKTICHSDFHFGNILIQDNKVKGVIDWGTTTFGRKEYDIASTRILLNQSFRSINKRIQFLIELFRKYIIFSYMNRYNKCIPLDFKLIQYFEALLCLNGIIFFYEYNSVTKEYKDRIDLYRKYFQKITGIKINIEF